MLLYKVFQPKFSFVILRWGLSKSLAGPGTLSEPKHPPATKVQLNYVLNWAK